MAKIGEEDPRWLVENRSDGKNVGNWHWAEKNLMPYAKQALADLFKNVNIPTSDGLSLQLNYDSVKGEVTVNNRKRRIFYLYDLEVKVKWSSATSDGTSGKGIIKAGDISQDNADDVFEVSITMDDETSNNAVLKDRVKEFGIPVVRQKIGQFLKEVREKHNELANQPTDNAENSIQIPEPEKKSQETLPVKIETKESTANSDTSTKIFTQTITFTGSCTPSFMYDMFLDSGRLSGGTQAPAQIDRRKGGDFSMFAGSIVGKILDLVPNEKIVQQWRFQNWPSGHFSTVTLEFKSHTNGVKLVLTQSGIPASDFDRTRSGWESHFWQRLRATFGLNYKIKK